MGVRRVLRRHAPSRFDDFRTAPTGHPAEKPTALLSRIVQESMRGPGSVLDPFMGSGSTLVAAKALGHTAIGIEADERWCEVAADRCRQENLGLSA